MNKNTFISFLLLFAFSFLLAHNFIPHHHHVEVSEVSHGHHHHDSDHHQHHKDHEDKQENEHHKNDPADLFSHQNGFFIASTYSISLNNGIENNSLPLIQTLGVVFKPLKTPLKPKIPDYSFISLIQTHYSSYSRRGPPSFIV